jgi:hypothetical protein
VILIPWPKYQDLKEQKPVQVLHLEPNPELHPELHLVLV